MGRNRMCGRWAVSCKSVLLGGEGSGQPCLCGVGGAALMRKSSCALPGGFAVVYKRLGEGGERLDPAQPCHGLGAAAILGCCSGAA